MTNLSDRKSLLCLRVETGGQVFMIPSFDVVAVRRWGGEVSSESYESSQSLPAIDLNKLLLDIEAPRHEGYILVISNSSGTSALVVDKMHPAIEIPSEEIHPLPSVFANLGCPFSNVTVIQPPTSLRAT